MRVSVVIPCYNAEPYIGQTIGSVLEQTRPADELLVVDDGSTDGSVEIARQFGDRVRLLTGRNGGAPATRNKGAAHATGDALMFLDADDVLGPTVLEVLTARLAEQSGAVAACPWYRLEYEDGRWVRRPPSCVPRRPGQPPLAAWLTGWYHPPCSVLWSRAAFERVGPWEEGLVVNQDGHLMMQALARGVPLVLADTGAAFYRRARLGDGSSVSGRRLSQEGLDAKLWVLDRLGQTLCDVGRLSEYRVPLDAALEQIAWEARDRHPEVAAAAAAVARRYTAYPWIRTMRRVRRRAASGLRAVTERIRRVTGLHQPPAPASPPKEVRYGLSEQPASSYERPD
jgi:glycosyltransferase involved in cell wall biosynthesis